MKLIERRFVFLHKIHSCRSSLSPVSCKHLTNHHWSIDLETVYCRTLVLFLLLCKCDCCLRRQVKSTYVGCLISSGEVMGCIKEIPCLFLICSTVLLRLLFLFVNKNSINNNSSNTRGLEHWLRCTDGGRRSAIIWTSRGTETS